MGTCQCHSLQGPASQKVLRNKQLAVRMAMAMRKPGAWRARIVELPCRTGERRRRNETNQPGWLLVSLPGNRGVSSLAGAKQPTFGNGQSYKN